jgi:hypothetical protein
MLHFQHILRNVRILPSEFIKALATHFDCKLYFRHHVNITSLYGIKLLELILCFILYISTIDGLLMLCFDLARSELECDSVVWNCITNTDANNIYGIQS